MRFSELVPYNEEMLSAITDTNVDIVRSAVKIFQQLGLIRILEDGTIFLPEVPKRIGKECESAERVRLYRERQNALPGNADVTKCNDNKDKDKYKDKNKEKDKDKEKIRHKHGEFGRILLTEKEYEKLICEFGKNKIDEQIKLLDEYVESNNNKNKYTNFNLVIRKSIRNNWFNNKRGESNEKDYSIYDK